MNDDELTRMDVIAFALAAYEVSRNNAHVPQVEAYWLDLFDKWVRMFDISTDELNNFSLPDLRERYDMRMFNLQVTKEMK